MCERCRQYQSPEYFKPNHRIWSKSPESGRRQLGTPIPNGLLDIKSGQILQLIKSVDSVRADLFSAPTTCLDFPKRLLCQIEDLTPHDRISIVLLTVLRRPEK